MKQVIVIGGIELNDKLMLTQVLCEGIVGDVRYAVFVVVPRRFFRFVADCSHQILSSVIFNRIFSLKIFSQNLNRFVSDLIYYASFGFSLTNCCCYESGAETMSQEIERQTCDRSCSFNSFNDEANTLRSKTLICNLTTSQNSSLRAQSSERRKALVNLKAMIALSLRCWGELY